MSKLFYRGFADMLWILFLPLGGVFTVWLLTFGSFDFIEVIHSNDCVVAQIMCCIVYFISGLARWAYLEEKNM